MITLYTFGPSGGLPDPSPFVMKAETLLKIAGLTYRIDTTGFAKAPKRKLPYIDDDGVKIPDSTFIRQHIETKYRFDFERGLSAEQKAIAWAFEKMAEDNLYWTIVDARWMHDHNFDKGPRFYFQSVPAPIRPLIIKIVRRQVRKSLHGQGIGRHTDKEIVALARRSIDAMATYLGDKPFFMGAEPKGVDATIFAFVASALCQLFTTPIRDHAERHGNLRRYVGRMTARYYSDYTEIAGCPAEA
jgi:glutathione S-transferase